MADPAHGGDEPPSTQAAAARTVRSDRHALPEPRGTRLTLLSLLALGVVYGDIGTSPL